MTKINSKNAARHILLATTDLKERGVVVPATVAKEAVEMAEQELKDKAVEAFCFCGACQNISSQVRDSEDCPFAFDCEDRRLFTQKLK